MAWRLDEMVEELKAIEMGFSDYMAIRQKEFDWLRRGKEQGAYQTKLETARSFLAYGDSPEKVAICTGLPLDVVRGLV